MRSFTNYTKMGIRTMSIFSFGLCGISIVAALVYLVLKLIFWESFSLGIIPIILLILLFGSFQLAFLGIIGEYIFSVNERVINRPLVIEKERLKFEKKEKKCNE